MRTEEGERIVLCFDRDFTVSVNPRPGKEAVPIGWVQYWAHETDIPVWATGNQHLKSEAEIPGIEEAERAWMEYIAGEEYEYENSNLVDYSKPRRRDGLRLIQDVYEAVFPDEDFRFIVVDDVDVSDLSEEGPWTHYLPWDFFEQVQNGETELEEPPSDSYTNDGIPFNSTDDADFDYNREESLEEIQEELKEAYGVTKPEN